jgi:protein-L-isoaspartate(D-aspartate) O-methyltransferase
MKPIKVNQPRALDFIKARERMIKEQIISRGIKDSRVVEAMQQVPRDLFIPEALAGQAYGDFALPIGEGQTISQPYTVAYMCENLALSGKERVLEIGTGTGYHTAVLSHLAEWVYSVERIRSLLEQARRILEQIQRRNVITRLSDGSYGWKEEAPFDAILVTAGAPSVPEPLMEQLKTGGTLVIPVGGRNVQRLVKIRRTSQGFIEENLMECSFVALVGHHGWPRREKYDPYSPNRPS